MAVSKSIWSDGNLLIYTEQLLKVWEPPWQCVCECFDQRVPISKLYSTWVVQWGLTWC